MGLLAQGQRWTAARKREVVLRIFRGDPLKAELDHAMKRLGELTMENELLWARVRRPGPFAQRRSKT